jgi:serine/threonine protein kinase
LNLVVMPPSADPVRVGRYQIVEPIGHGGMGTVYRAHDPQINRLVALKILNKHDERFLPEVQAAGNLKHPNIVTVYDCFEFEGQCVIVMEHVNGRTLEHVIGMRMIDEVLVKLQLLRQLCSALGYAHERGIIHRDIKPANLMVERNGRLKVLDFGIARIGEASQTERDRVMGTLQYMSPEQLRGGSVDRRADIYAAGVVMYELLAAVHPFRRRSVQELMYAIVNEQPRPLTEMCPELPPDLSRIANSALHKDPGRRYTTAGLMAEDLFRIEKALTKTPAVNYEVIREKQVIDDPTPGDVATRAEARSVLSRAAQLAIAIPLFAAIAVAVVILRPPTNPSVSPPLPPSTSTAGATAKAKREIDLLQQRCARGSVKDCHEAALAKEHGSDGRKDLSLAATLYLRACDLGSIEDCNNAGAIYLNDTVFSDRRAQAIGLLTRTCGNDSARGCLHLGAAYSRGNGVIRNDVQAARFYRRACDGGEVRGCAELAFMYAVGRGVKKDDARASGLLQLACDGALPEACQDLAQRYDRGEGVERSPTQSVLLARRAAQLRAKASK